MPEPHYADDLVTLHLGDCLDVMAAMPDASVDAVVTDPPYGLEFMGREWDTFKTGDGFRRRRNAADTGRDDPFGRASRTSPEYIAGQPFQRWCEAWSAECLRALKPGGHLLAFGGTRTYHRLTCGIEDAGFEIRDSLHWLYGSGFPKSLDVSKAIDKAAGAQREVVGVKASNRPNVIGLEPGGSMGGGAYTQRLETAPATEDAARWSGWGTALKPSHEPIVVARKPLAGTVAANVLEFDTGALNVDGCRVGTTDDLNGGAYAANGTGRHDGAENWRYKRLGGAGEFEQPPGRWPPNLLLTHSADCNGTCAPGCPVAGLDGQSGTLTSGEHRATERRHVDGGNGVTHGKMAGVVGMSYADSGGASRFFPVLNWDPEYDLPFMYCAKAPKSERPQAEGVSAHPTVKPLAVMRWLVRLVTPPGGLVLDPFAGTGTTGQACALGGFRCVLAERDPDSAELARVRLAKPVQQQMMLDLPALPTTE